MQFKQKIQQISPRAITIFLIVVIIFIGAAVGIANWRRQQLEVSPVNLTITSPSQNEETTESAITVSGNTEGGALVDVNGQSVQADDQGLFETPVDLKEGLNTIEVVATKENRRASTRTFDVTRKVVVIQPPVEVVTPPVAVAEEPLPSTGPENFFIPEVMMLSAAGSSWILSKKALRKRQAQI